MIDVPVEVKDALRDGRLKKNYRIVVLNNREGSEVLDNLLNYTWTLVEKSGLYRFYYSNANIDIGIRIGMDGGGYWPADPIAPYFSKEFYIEGGSRVMAYSSSLEQGEPFMELIRNPEVFTLDNNDLVSESVNIDERLCSDSKIKFGLCEGSSIEFQYFGHPTILGKCLQVFIDVDYGAEDPYTIPMGFFDVQRCSRQASTGIIKVTAYNKLMSEYLDAKANTQIDTLTPDVWYPTRVTVYKIRKDLLANYSVDYLDPEQVPVHPAGQSGLGLTLWTDTSYTFKVPGDSTSWNPEIGTTGGKWIKTPEYSSGEAYFIIKRIHEFEEMIDNMVDDLEQQIKAVVLNPDDVWSYVKRGFVYSACMIVHASAITRRYTTDKIYNYAGSGSGALKFSSFTELDVSDVRYIEFYTPTWFQGHKNGTQVFQPVARSSPTEGWEDTVIQNLFKLDMTLMSRADKIQLKVSEIPDVTLRDIISSSYETQCLYGQLDRETDLFSGVELNHSRLLPADTLYPDNALYPAGAQSSTTKSMYSQLWADEGNVRKWRNLLITYKGLDENQQEKDFVYTVEVNADGTDDYECNDNWLFRNLVWSEGYIGIYATAMVAKMQDMTWFPFEMWCAGLPYLETGDEIEIPLGQNSYTSYVLQRQLKGIQNLQDTYINGTLDIF